jgi:hypothetical protein
MFHADGQTDGGTDITMLIVAFRNFVNAPKKRKEKLATNTQTINNLKKKK